MALLNTCASLKTSLAPVVLHETLLKTEHLDFITLTVVIMSKCMNFTEGEFYQEHFDSNAYVKNFYSCPRGHSDEKNFLTFVLRCLSRVFSTGEYPNQTNRQV